MDKSTAVIIDDHPVFRAGIISIIHDDFKVIGEAGTAEEGFSLIQELKPDIAIIDILLPDYNGILLTQKIMKSPNMNVRVMIISAHSKMDYVKEAVQSGALGYVIKESGEDCINKCLKSIKDGRKFIDHSLSETMCESFSDEKELQQKINDYNRLSEREQEIIRLLLQGKSMKEIAFILNISYKTVSSHKTRVYAKLGIKGDLDLVRFARKIRLIAKKLDES